MVWFFNKIKGSAAAPAPPPTLYQKLQLAEPQAHVAIAYDPYDTYVTKKNPEPVHLNEATNLVMQEVEEAKSLLARKNWTLHKRLSYGAALTAAGGAVALGVLQYMHMLPFAASLLPIAIGALVIATCLLLIRARECSNEEERVKSVAQKVDTSFIGTVGISRAAGHAVRAAGAHVPHAAEPPAAADAARGAPNAAPVGQAIGRPPPMPAAANAPLEGGDAQDELPLVVDEPEAAVQAMGRSWWSAPKLSPSINRFCNKLLN